jgi:tocopherol cyclase
MIAMFGNFIPTHLRGNFRQGNYFEGWFQKVYSAEYQASFIIIYGYATQNSLESFGFIQLLLPDGEPRFLYFHKNEISCDPTRHVFKMGSHILSTEVIRIQCHDINIQLSLLKNTPIRTLKNSMGYTYYVPGLPCYHAVLNPSHQVSGIIQAGQQHYHLDNATGYLEKNWGKSFPERYFWMHAVDPKNPEISILFSRAEIKWMGLNFIRHVGHFKNDGAALDLRHFKNFQLLTSPAEQNQRLLRIGSKETQMEICIRQGKKVLFKGPTNGKLSRSIPHHADAQVDVSLSQNQKRYTFRLQGNFEQIGKLF